MADFNDFYKNFTKFENVYRDFTTATLRNAEALATLSPITYLTAGGNNGSAKFYTELISLVFPAAGGAFYPADVLWEKIEALGTTAPAITPDPAAQAVAYALRVYYYDGVPPTAPPPAGDSSGVATPAPENLETKIKDWYTDVKKGNRKSAYLIPGDGATAAKPPPGAKPAAAAAAAEDKFGLLRDSLGTEPALANSSKLMMILVDTPIIDMKFRGTEKVDAFMNYSPSILMSQCVPYFDAQFILNRKNIPSNVGIVNNLAMGQLKFLMGPEAIDTSVTNATSLIYDSSILKAVQQEQASSGMTNDQFQAVITQKLAETNSAEVDFELEALPTKSKGSSTPPATAKKAPAKRLITVSSDRMAERLKPRITTKYIAGMELFTMPQTLINMNYDKVTTRYQPVLNPTLPFGVITNLSVSITPSVGVISFKSAKLTLRIFDRSRMVEIADFLNPKLYQSTTIWLTYGWRAPEQSDSENPYLTFINENMMTREAYGVKGTSMSIDDSGMVTIILDLFTKGASELIQASPTVINAAFEQMQEDAENNIAELKDILGKLGIKSYSAGGKAVRGSILIDAANSGTSVETDYKTLQEEMSALTTALKKINSPDSQRAQDLIQKRFTRPNKESTQTQAQDDIKVVAKTVAKTRFSSLSTSNGKDLFSAFDGKYDGDAADSPYRKAPGHPVLNMLKAVKPKTGNAVGSVNKDATAADDKYGGFGKISFGKLFFNFFLQCAANANNIIEEFQVIFYKLNSRAGRVASINIAEFPIDMNLLEKAYGARVQEQKGENMSILNFLEIVRSSQFEDIRHRAFGFNDSFVYGKDGNLVQSTEKPAVEKFQQNVANNFGIGSGGSFMQPTLDFFIETGCKKVDGAADNSLRDLLKQFQRDNVVMTTTATDKSTQRIMRIHIYDRAATPNHTASTIMRHQEGEVTSFAAVDTTAFRKAAEVEDFRAEVLDTARTAVTPPAASATTPSTPADAATPQTAPLPPATEIEQARLKRVVESSGTKVEVYKFTDFASAKKKIAEFTPTILIGSNGTAVKSVSYSTGQDALLATIMMLRNNSNATSVTNPNGSSGAGLPLRVIPGQLSLTTLGCPLVQHMQQYFIDLGTGTTVDNLYNVTSLTHNMSPGSYQTEIKLTFHDAYGQYENPQSFVDQIKVITNEVDSVAKNKEEEKKTKKQ